MKMYFSYFKHQLKISLQYRVATFLMIITSFFTVVASVIAFILLFEKFDTVGGYSLSDVLFTYASTMLIFSLSEFFFRGFDQFDKLIRYGQLDVLLLRPRGLIVQILGYKVEFGKLGRIFISTAIMIFVMLSGHVQWNGLKILTTFLIIISGTVIFLGVFLLMSAYNIFSINSNEIVNVFTNGGRELASYPLDIYNKFIKNFFTFIIPFGAFNYLPLHYILGYENTNIWLNVLSPVWGMFFIIPCLIIFNWAVKKYSSSGT